MKLVKRVITVRATGLACALLGCGILGLSPAYSAEAPAQHANAIPATEGTWKSIDQSLAELVTRITAGKLDDLGHSAYGIANLVKTLPGQSSALPAADLAKVSASVKVVGAEVTKLDKAGEKGDKAGVDADLTVLKKTLGEIRQLYYR